MRVVVPRKGPTTRLTPLLLLTVMATLAAGIIYTDGGSHPTASASSGPVVVATVPVEGQPQGAAVNPNTNLIYVANGGSNDVSVIDGASNTVAATVPVGTIPHGVAVNPNTNRIYVTNENTDNVSVIDGDSNTVVATVAVGYDPYGVAVNPNTNLIYVTDRGFWGTVSVIDGDTDMVVASVRVSTWPEAVAVNPITNRIYVANDDLVSIIDGDSNTVVATGGGGSNPDAVAVNPNTNLIYVANAGDNSVSVIDGSSDTVVATVGVGIGPDAVAVNPISNRIYVGYPESNNVSIIDGSSNTVVATTAVGRYPSAVAVNPYTNLIYVTNSYDDTVSVIRDEALSPCIPSSDTPNGIHTCGMEPGDVLLTHTTVSPIYGAENLMFHGYWTHAGIYLGNNWIVESYSNSGPPSDTPGVVEKLISNSKNGGFWDAEDWVVLRPKSASSAQGKAAAQWAATQAGKHYNWNYLHPGCTMPFPGCVGSYYCSQLVWQAYQYQGLDIQLDKVPFAVAPDKLYNTSKMTVVDQRHGAGVVLKRALLQILSPADFYVTDPQGRHVGVDPQTGATVNEIPGVFYSGAGTEPQFMSIPDMDGTWQVQLIGTATGSYTFTSDTVDPSGAVEASVSGATSTGHIDSYSLSYPEQAGEPITVEPASPVGGIAEYTEDEPDATLGVGGSPGPNALTIAVLASGFAVLLAAGAWYARRRWLT